MTPEAMERIRKTIQRRIDAGDKMQVDLTALVDRADLETVRTVARLMTAECGYLGDHLPSERERVAPFACSGETYHFCSFSTQHDPGCPAVGGNGQLANGYDHTTPCALDCGETEPESWCHACGFDCPTCELVDELLGILAAHGKAH